MHYRHPPRGRGRKRYRMSDKALQARRRNLSKSRLRSDRESRTIKLLIWQAGFESGPRRSQRTLARQLGVWPSYVCKVQRKALSEGMDTLVKHGNRVTATDLDEARRFTTRIRDQEPGLLAPALSCRLYGGEARGEQRRFAGAMTADEIIREQRRFAEEWKRKNPRYGRHRVQFSVPVPH
jgi:hypothetical protein